MRRLEWRPKADEDRDAHLDYIARDNPIAAIEAGDEIERQVELLPEFPEVGRPGRIEGTRELVVAGLPFIVCYAVTDEAVTILRILHGRQDWPDEI